MPWSSPSFTPEHKQWLLQGIESLCSDPDRANLGHVRGQCDLEAVIVVAGKDRGAFSHEVLARLERELKERTGVMKPVIYLDGNRPQWLEKETIWDY